MIVNIRTTLIVLVIFLSIPTAYAITKLYIEPAQERAYDRMLDVRDAHGQGRADQENFENLRASSHEVATFKDENTLHLAHEERIITFGERQTALSPEMKRRLDTITDVITSRSQIKGIRILDFTDRDNNSKQSDMRSSERAENVRRYLATNQLIADHTINMHGFGAKEFSVNCSKSAAPQEREGCLQDDRHVEVEIDYMPDLRASR